MSAPLLLVVYCLFIIAASILGGLLPIVIRLTHTRLQVIISLTAGFMLGVAVLHMIPHAMGGHGNAGLDPTAAMSAALIGFLVMFFIERFFSFHSHETAEAHGTPGNKLSWTGAAIGMTLHSAVAGVALASSVASEADGGSGTAALAGLAVFLVIVLHKPLDALTVITLTAAAGLSNTSRHFINGLFALAVPLGVVLFGLGLNQTALAESGTLVGAVLAFSAGTFLCISLSDLLPELHFHSHDRAKLTAALVLGVALAYVIAAAEHSLHDHEHIDHAGHGHHEGHGPGVHESHEGHDHASHDGHGHGAPQGHDHGAHGGHKNSPASKDAWADFLDR